MNKNLQKIDELFSAGLKDFEKIPPGEIWQNIENSLDKSEAILFKKKYKTLLKMVSVSSVLILILSGVYFSNYFSKTSLLKKSIAKTYNEEKTGKSMNAILRGEKEQAYKNRPSATFSVIKINKTVSRKLNSFSNANETDWLNAFKNEGYNFHSPISLSQIPALVAKAEEMNPLFLETKTIHNYVEDINKNSTNKSSINLTFAKNKPSIYITPFFSADLISARFIKIYEPDDEQLQENNRNDFHLSYTTGLNIEYKFSKKASIQSGLFYSQWFAPISPAVVNALQDNTGNYKFKLTTNYGIAELHKQSWSLPQIGDSLSIKDGYLNLQSISFPALIKLNIKQGKLNLGAVGGAAINLMTKDVAEVEYFSQNGSEKETVQKLEGLRNIYFSAIAGLEGSYNINNSVSVNFYPLLRYAITPVNKETPVKTYPINIGIGAGLQIKL